MKSWEKGSKSLLNEVLRQLVAEEEAKNTFVPFYTKEETREITRVAAAAAARWRELNPRPSEEDEELDF